MIKKLFTLCTFLLLLYNAQAQVYTFGFSDKYAPHGSMLDYQVNKIIYDQYDTTAIDTTTDFLRRTWYTRTNSASKDSTHVYYSGNRGSSQRSILIDLAYINYYDILSHPSMLAYNDFDSSVTYDISTSGIATLSSYTLRVRNTDGLLIKEKKVLADGTTEHEYEYFYDTQNRLDSVTVIVLPTSSHQFDHDSYKIVYDSTQSNSFDIYRFTQGSLHNHTRFKLSSNFKLESQEGTWSSYEYVYDNSGRLDSIIDIVNSMPPIFIRYNQYDEVVRVHNDYAIGYVIFDSTTVNPIGQDSYSFASEVQFHLDPDGNLIAVYPHNQLVYQMDADRNIVHISDTTILETHVELPSGTIVTTQIQGIDDYYYGYETYKKTDLLSIREVTFEEHGLNIFPNPTSDFINVEFKNQSPKDATISILDQLGRVVNNQNIGQKSKIDMSMLPPGIYFLHLQSSELTRNLTVPVTKR